MTDGEDFYRSHGPLSDPGRHRDRLAGLGGDAASLCAVVQGLLLHDHQGGRLYGEPPRTFFEASRETLPVEERLDAVFARDDRPLDRARPPFEREVGTCRDIALLLVSLLREAGRPARVRCGFAAYFTPGRWEDHWVCERWSDDTWAWRLADAQLDEAHRNALAIDFAVDDMPRDRFVTAPEAWRLCRQGADPAMFGHGDTTGLWFVALNVARDALALRKQERSPWDGWRDGWLGGCGGTLTDDQIAWCDRLAGAACPRVDRDPFWLA